MQSVVIVKTHMSVYIFIPCLLVSLMQEAKVSYFVVRSLRPGKNATRLDAMGHRPNRLKYTKDFTVHFKHYIENGYFSSVTH